MKIKLIPLTLLSLLSTINFAQITDPTPYCEAIYSDDFFMVPHHIERVELNTLDNDTGPAPFAEPHYVYYNGIPATDLNVGDTYDLVITHDDGVTIHGIAAWIDFNDNNVFDDMEKVGETLWPAGTNPLTYSFTVPAGAVPGITRMRIRVYEDDEYTFSGVDLPVLPCQYDIGAGLTDYDWGETEDYDVNIVDPGTGGDLMALFTPEGGTICIGEDLTFTDASTTGDVITDWSWTFDGGVPADATTEGPHTVNFAAPGTYNITLEVTDATGTDDVTFEVNVIDCDALNASFTPSSEEICLNDCITFTDGSTGAGITGWAWTFSDPAIGGPLTGADPGSVCFPTAGDIDVTLTVTDGVTFDDTTITIRVNPLPTVTAIASTATTVCEGTTIVLSGTGDALGYNWDMGVTDGEAFVINETTTFTVTGFNNFACEDTDEITITVVPCEPLLPGFSFDDIICVGDCITFTDTSQGDPVSHAWDFGGGGEPAASTDQNPTICFNTAGIFDIQLTVTNELGESASTTNSITVFASPMVTAEQDTVIDLGGTAALVATGSIPEGSYIWEPDDYINCETCDLTSTNPPTTTTYQVTLTDVNGCTATDTVVVYVNFERALGVPDAFTPNGDGFNDVLYVRGFGLEAIKFSVYNKYGEKVFESLTQDIGWDGKFRGKEENPGVFTWVVEYEFIDGNSGSRKGTVTLIR